MPKFFAINQHVALCIVTCACHGHLFLNSAHFAIENTKIYGLECKIVGVFVASDNLLMEKLYRILK